MRRRPIQVFNFSFLDILATTIGVLLFILLLSVLQQSGWGDVVQWQEKLRQAQSDREDAVAAGQRAIAQQEAARRELEEARQAAAGAATEAAALARESERIEARIKTTRDGMETLSARKSELERRTVELRASVDAPELERKLPKAAGGAEAEPVHVDCGNGALVIMGTDLTLPGRPRETVPISDIPRPDSAFGRLMRDVKENSVAGRAQVIVLWVRPDGIDTADKAIEAARRADVPLGWEPANADWAF